MLNIENQIPRFDTLCKNYESRYYTVDSTLSGVMRFAYGISNYEAVLKDGTYSKCSEIANSGDLSLKIDNPIYGISNNSYIVIKDKFYLVNYVEDDTIYLYNSLLDDLNIGDKVKLFSTNVTIDNKGICTELEFRIGTTISYSNFSYTIKEGDTVDSVKDIIAKHSIVRNFGSTIYAIGKWSSTLSYFKIYNEYPISSGFLNVYSNNFIVRGDNLLLFNEDIRANNTITVESLVEKQSPSGFCYIIATDDLYGSFKYAQLKAYPAYISKKINIHNLKPSILDLCYGTVYGTSSNLLKGFKKYYQDEELTNGFEEFNYIAELNTEPSDLLLCEVLSGKMEIDLPNLILYTNDDGIFRMYIDSKIDEKFSMRFNNIDGSFKVSITDYNGNVLASGKSGDYIESHLNKVTINIKCSPGVETVFDTFKVLKRQCTHIQYYFVCREDNNDRMEVNGLHLNPIFKNYRELLAVIGRDKVNEGRIAL